MKEELIIDIDEDGRTIEMEVKGQQGRRCLELTQFLEQALGDIVVRRLKSEYFVKRARTRLRQRLCNREGPL